MISFKPVAILLLASSSTTARPDRCNIRLDSSDNSCISNCMSQSAADNNSFVCDETVPWLHHRGGDSHWMNATPPPGTGVHVYSVFQGSPPCARNGHCAACGRTPGTRLCSVRIDPQDCSITCNEEDSV
ncbi:exostoses (multiple)-like 2 [Seminavis robusta]|uniref:Exostoses (Multiple)-like 2 n=1 Tax=Seminavis robusta TaxID=568900 RepID=A0A9N8GZA2_9STRA|nr:exostoses (multiple)-like 2 [Seminavis robusta]|eukprot:Sro1_g000670.1 exostoses (multiple)-like 2 (129) ;mRNA; r:190659-191045